MKAILIWFERPDVTRPHKFSRIPNCHSTIGWHHAGWELPFCQLETGNILKGHHFRRAIMCHPLERIEVSVAAQNSLRQQNIRQTFPAFGKSNFSTRKLTGGGTPRVWDSASPLSPAVVGHLATATTLTPLEFSDPSLKL